jgi:Ca-activated chloride channel family protein
VSFLEAPRLWLLVLPVLVVGLYLIALRRKTKYAIRFSDVSMLDGIASDRPGWRRHVTAAALLLAVALVVVAFARPVMAQRVPVEQAAVIMAMDVSLSMQATDVAPSRIDAAKEAANDFVALAPEDLRLGLVAFAGVALPALPPTTDRLAAASAIDRLSLGEGTAIGDGLSTALDLAAAEHGGEANDEDVPVAIVVLSDGETTVGRAELDVAAEAAAAGIPVYTISFGTQAGSIEFQGEVVPVPVNEGALRQVASLTGGKFFTAASAAELQQILDGVGTQVGYETEEREVWEWFLGAGVVALTLAAAGSLVWFSKLP